MLFQFFNPEDVFTVTQGHLPHWDQAGATYFITWRTADSIPKEVWIQWRDEREDWLANHGIDPKTIDWRRKLEELPEKDRREYRRFTRAMDENLDSCHGECPLRQPHLAEIVADTLRFFDGSRYVLGDFVVMPNHVHLLVGGLAQDGMLKQVESWKKWSAKVINRHLGRRGRFWQDECFDHLVRSRESFEQYREYIAENPSKAGLKAGEFLWWRRE